MPKKYVVKLKRDERQHLQTLSQNGKGSAKMLTHARILLKADQTKGQPAWTDETISDALDISVATVERVRQKYVCHGLDAAVKRRARERERTRRLDGKQEAHLIALTCSEPPAGHARWTMRLLADRMIELEYVDELSRETVRRTLKKTNSNRG
jgi:transposase